MEAYTSGNSLCSCSVKAVQSEVHVMLECPLSAQCREKYPRLDFANINVLLGVTRSFKVNVTLKLCIFSNIILTSARNNSRRLIMLHSVKIIFNALICIYQKVVCTVIFWVI